MDHVRNDMRDIHDCLFTTYQIPPVIVDPTIPLNVTKEYFPLSDDGIRLSGNGFPIIIAHI